MCQLSISVRKVTLSKFVFVDDVSSFGLTHEYYKNWATTNFYDSTVLIDHSNSSGDLVNSLVYFLPN